MRPILIDFNAYTAFMLGVQQRSKSSRTPNDFA